MPDLIRSACLTNYVDIARQVGLDPFRMLRDAGIDRRCLEDPDLKMPVGALGKLLESSARKAGIDDFGLRLAETRSLAILGPIGLLLREEPTVGAVIASLVRYIGMHNEALELHLRQADGQAIFSVNVKVGRPVPIRQGVELTVGVLFRLLTGLAGPGWRPRVMFAHPAPSVRSCHRRVFGAPVEFDAELNGITFPDRDLGLRAGTAEPALRRYAQQYLDSIIGRRDFSSVDKARELIGLMLPSGRCSAELVATQMGMDRRTLHRYLAGEGTNFSDLLDAVRTDIATRVMQSGDRPLYVVAEILGFSGLSAFSRWFRSRFGLSATDWRERTSPRAVSATA